MQFTHTPISNGQLLVWVCLETNVSKYGPFHADYWLHVPISPFSVKPNIKILYPLFLPPIWVAGLNRKWSDNFSRALCKPPLILYFHSHQINGESSILCYPRLEVLACFDVSKQTWSVFPKSPTQRNSPFLLFNQTRIWG